MSKRKSTEVQGIEISYQTIDDEPYINLTDIARYKNPKRPEIPVQRWIGTNKTIEFLLAWEIKNNPHFKHTENHVFKGYEKFAAEMVAGKNTSVSKWINYTDAAGLKVIRGRWGGTFAHKHIAFHFASWINADFYLYVVEEFDRLKKEELIRLGDPFRQKRHLAAGNHALLASAILTHMDERLLTHPQPYKSRLPFASEADMLNKIVFGMTAQEWKEKNTDKPADRNMRDYASIVDLAILNNLEFLDAMLLNWDCEKEEREKLLQEAYDFQYPILQRSKTLKRLQELADNLKR
ncbi:MAG TPA: KilA-N domain-containing protein [Phaeodactylibacter sp.]|nr:KilA-N domain-containing protein [Phaeodactylibacter sp.]